MPDQRNPSGIPSPSDGSPKNRFTRGLERRPTVGTAASGFGAHIAGMVLLIISVFIMIAGLTMVFGSLGNGWPGRTVGAGLLIGGAAVFVAGRWLLLEYAVQHQPR
jgi:hypothetical protein